MKRIKNILTAFFISAFVLISAQTEQDNQKERIVQPSKNKNTTNIIAIYLKQNLKKKSDQYKTERL